MSATKSASTSISLARLEAYRARVYRRTPARRVQTLAQAERFVNEVGYCFFWPIKGVEMPSLFHAVAGRVRDVPMEHDDPDISKTWGWKDQSLGVRRWYYGKLLSRRATLVSLDWLPTFYALSSNYGGETDYVEEYEAGLLSREAKLIYEAVQSAGPLDTVRLRRDCGLASEASKASFERALVDLQVGMKILPIGVAEAGAWRYAFIYDLVARHFPEPVQHARGIARSEARDRLVGRYVDNVGATTEARLKKVFSVLRWTSSEVDHTLERLIRAGRLTRAQVEGERHEALASTSALRLQAV